MWLTGFHVLHRAKSLSVSAKEHLRLELIQTVAPTGSIHLLWWGRLRAQLKRSYLLNICPSELKETLGKNRKLQLSIKGHSGPLTKTTPTQAPPFPMLSTASHALHQQREFVMTCTISSCHDVTNSTFRTHQVKHCLRWWRLCGMAESSRGKRLVSGP